MLAQIRHWLARRNPANSPEKVQARNNILQAQTKLQELIANGEVRSVEDQCTLRHFFAPTDPAMGKFYNYARCVFLPAGSVIFGKLHKHPCLNFVMKGRCIVSTEHGQKEIAAPAIFVSEPGIKRALYVQEDTIWATVHLTRHNGEENLAAIEGEVIAGSYEDLGLLSSFQGEKQ